MPDVTVTQEVIPESSIPVLDHGFLFGDGVFEGIRVTPRGIFRFPDHMKRLETAARAIAGRHGERPLDALALSLSCEFLARAACAEPGRYRSLALASPTGFAGTDPASGPPGSTRALPGLHQIGRAHV